MLKMIVYYIKYYFKKKKKNSIQYITLRSTLMNIHFLCTNVIRNLKAGISHTILYSSQ